MTPSPHERIEDEADACNDTNGKAVFLGVFRGWLNDGSDQTSFDAQVLDCQLDYDSGMSC